MPSIALADMGKRDKALEAELDRRAQQRADWNLDALPADWSVERGLQMRSNEVGLAVAQDMVGKGLLTMRQLNQLRGALYDRAIGESDDMADYLARTGRARTPGGAIVEVVERGQDEFTRTRQRVHAGDHPDRLVNAQQIADIERKIARHAILELNKSGAIGDADTGRYFREQNILDPGLLDEHGEPISADDATLGAEEWGGHTGWAGADPEYVAGTLVREEAAKAHKPTPRDIYAEEAKKEMAMDPSFVADWEKRHSRNLNTPQGRSELEASERAKLKAAVKDATEALNRRASREENIASNIDGLRQRLDEAMSPSGETLGGIMADRNPAIVQGSE